MLRIPLLLCLFSISATCFSQSYIVVGDALRQGKIQIRSKDEIIFYDADVHKGARYTAAQVKEFKQKWTTYETFELNGKPAFFRKVIANDNISYYRLRRHYILKNKSTGIATGLNKKNFRGEIKNILAPNATDDDLSRLTYSNREFKFLVRTHNRGEEYDIKKISYRKFGVIVGYNMLHVQASPTFARQFGAHIKAPSVGLFADIPVSPDSWMYISGEANFSTYNPALYHDFSGSTQFMALQINAINVIPAVKIAPTLGRVSPYVKAGFVVSIQQIRSLTDYLETTGTGEVHTNELHVLDSENSEQFSYLVAAGMHIRVGGHKNIHVEIRSTKSMNKIALPLNLTYSNVALNLGFSF